MANLYCIFPDMVLRFRDLERAAEEVRDLFIAELDGTVGRITKERDLVAGRYILDVDPDLVEEKLGLSDVIEVEIAWSETLIAIVNGLMEHWSPGGSHLGAKLSSNLVVMLKGDYGWPLYESELVGRITKIFGREARIVQIWDSNSPDGWPDSTWGSAP